MGFLKKILSIFTGSFAESAAETAGEKAGEAVVEKAFESKAKKEEEKVEPEKVEKVEVREEPQPQVQNQTTVVYVNNPNPQGAASFGMAEEYMKYMIFDDDNNWVGIKEDSPETLKYAYREYLKEQKEQKD